MGSSYLKQPKIFLNNWYTLYLDIFNSGRCCRSHGIQGALSFNILAEKRNNTMLWSTKKIKKQKISIHKGSSGWKEPTQNNISRIHSSQPEYLFSSHASEVFPSFHAIFCIYSPLNDFKQAWSGKCVMSINAMRPRKESLGMVLCCWNLSLTAESARLD